MSKFLAWLAGVLYSRGWLQEPTTCPVKIAEAVEAFQRYWGLEPDGDLDPATVEAIDAPRFCGLPDVMEQRSGVCKWNDGNVDYFVQDAFPGLTHEETWQAFDWMAQQWSAAANLRMKRAANASAARIVGTVIRLDGPNGVLADAQLPCGGITFSRQRYDSSEAWNRTIQARLVILHESGHSLGISHIGGGNVMAPTYNPALVTLQAGDVAEIVSRYGRPTAPVPPVPTPDDGRLIVDTSRKVFVAPLGWRIETRPN